MFPCLLHGQSCYVTLSKAKITFQNKVGCEQPSRDFKHDEARIASFFLTGMGAVGGGVLLLPANFSRGEGPDEATA